MFKSINAKVHQLPFYSSQLKGTSKS